MSRIAPSVTSGNRRYLEANRRRWDEVVPLHAASLEYDVAGFRRGRITLKPLERREVGSVRGKSLLHLQCHFGLDTLSWARLGARVTGVDFSRAAIRHALRLAVEVGIEARFVCSTIESLPRVLASRFDVVYTAKGVLSWLPNVHAWAKVIAHFLRPGGIFYLLEGHPAANVYESERKTRDLRFQVPYFHASKPERFESDWTYVTAGGPLRNRAMYNWQHSVGDVLNALLEAGLRIEFVHEFPYTFWKQFPFMRRGRDGWWHLTRNEGFVPLMWSVKATRRR